MEDFGHLFGCEITASFDIQHLAAGTTGSFQQAEHLGRRYLKATTSEADAKNGAGEITVRFTIPAHGFYALEGLPLGIDGSSDSFNLLLTYARTGATKPIRWKFNPRDAGSFAWSPIYGAFLPPGDYRLDLTPRERNAGVAALRVVRHTATN